MRSPRSVCSKGSSHTAHSLPMNVRSLRVLALSMSSMPAMPLEERGGAVEPKVEVLLIEWELVKGFSTSAALRELRE